MDKAYERKKSKKNSEKPSKTPSNVKTGNCDNRKRSFSGKKLIAKAFKGNQMTNFIEKIEKVQEFKKQ